MLLGSINTLQNAQSPLVLATTATLNQGATSATLSASFNPATGIYTVIFSDGETRQVTLTNGATTATWQGGLASGVTTAITVIVGVAGPITAATALPANIQRQGWSIQNQSTNVLYVALGSGCTSSLYHYTLKASTGTADGSGGSISQSSGTIYNGIITIAGTNPSYTVVELSS